MSFNANVQPYKVLAPFTAANACGAPISVAAAGTLKTGWLLATDPWIYLVVMAGVIDCTSVAVTWEQDDDGDGVSHKTLNTGDFASGGAAVAITVGATDDGKAFALAGRSEYLDRENGFKYVQATLTVTGGSGSLFAICAMSGPQRYST